MPLIGKFVRHEGTGVIFASKKGEWRPIDLTGQFDANVLAPGDYYELELQDNRLFNAKKLPPRGGGGGGGPGASHSSSGGSYAAPARSDVTKIPRQSLMASATGFAKSAMDAGLCKTPSDAAQAGLSWARLWDREATPVLDGIGAPTSPPAPRNDPMPEDGPNDDIPF